MSFLDKMKSGMNQVKDKAAQTVEVTRISSQISTKQKERGTQLEKLGQIVHQANQTGSLLEAMEHIQQQSNTIAQMELEIELLEAQLLRIKGEKRCNCGAVIPADSRFCNTCGNEVRAEYVAPSEPPLGKTNGQANAFCTNCGQQLESHSAYCTSCGAKTEQAQ